MNLLGQLGLGSAARSIYDMIMDLEAEKLSMPQLGQDIRSILKLHGFEACADAVIAALLEEDFAGMRRDGKHWDARLHDGEDEAAGIDSTARARIRVAR